MKNQLSAISSSTRSILSIAVILFGSLPLPASASNIYYYMDNKLNYYDGASNGVCSTVGTSYSTMLDIPLLTGATNAEKIWNFLISEGLSKEQTAGIMGNLRQESGPDFDPNLQEGNGVGYGIVQWSFERRDALEAMAEEKKVPVSDLGLQLAFMKHELQSPPTVDFRNLFSRFDISGEETMWELIKEQKTVEDATTFFHDAFERSGDYDNHGGIQHRIKFAEEIYEDDTINKALSNLAAGTKDAFCSAVGSGDLKATVLEYAHPEYHEPKFIEMMPAYAEAVKRAEADGRGVGGIAHPGIDCAGFVSLLIVDSGFDPEYNSKGMYSTPGETGEAIQRSWMQEHWEFLGIGGTPEVNVDMLLPGDVAVSYGSTVTQHIFIYVGQIDGFGNVYASASLDERAPMAGGTYENATSNEYEWYRKK